MGCNVPTVLRLMCPVDDLCADRFTVDNRFRLYADVLESTPPLKRVPIPKNNDNYAFFHAGRGVK